jgi:peptidoglycan biosynthesis protein MviN/MurJ (putative lipid II flippase)
MADFYGLIDYVKNIGVFEFYLPFVILFAMLYGLLNKSKIFGEPAGARSINLIIALGSAFFIMAYTPVGITLTGFFANFFTQSAVIMVTLVVLVMMVYLILPEKGLEGLARTSKTIAFLAMLLVVGIYISSGGLNIFPGSGVGNIDWGFGLSTEDIVIIGVIALTIFVMWYISKGGGGGGGGGGLRVGP